MADASEPPKKKTKENMLSERIDDVLNKIWTSEKNLTPVISEDIYKPIPLTNVIVGNIINQKDISKTILLLNEKIPLQKLQHLKRVRKKEVLIVQVENLAGLTVAEYLDENAGNVREVFDGFKEIEVPSLSPQIRGQFDESNKVWPCNFHPNKYKEKLAGNNFFDEEELKRHRQFTEIALEAVKFYNEEGTGVKLENTNACVVVDPTIQAVVAISAEKITSHPIQHAAMVAIDNVAKTQNGGSWIKDKDKLQSIDVNLRGIDEELYNHLLKRFPHIKFGARKFKSKNEGVINDLDYIDSPYLCTNYYAYFLREPCVMCAMALVHARVKRIFFIFDNPYLGGVKSKVKLQTLSSLNHHFEVFTGFL